MPRAEGWFKDRMIFKGTRLNFASHIEMQTQNLLVTYLYRQSFLGQITSLFCAIVLFLGLYSSDHSRTLLIGWFLYSLFVALFRIGITLIYQKQPSPEKKITVWKTLFVLGALLGGLSWGFAGSALFWYANNIQQTLIILIIAGITSGAVPILAANLLSTVLFLAASLLPLIVQLFFQEQIYIYSLLSITIIAYFLYMLVVAGRSHHLLKQTIGLQFEKEALTKYLQDANEKLDVAQGKLNLIETHDLLTGLPNRKLFMMTLKEAIKRAEISQKNLAVCYMDLDNFRFINDAYGYETGDQLLQSVIQKIRGNLREPDFLARMGGDELAMILENQSSQSNIAAIAKQICQVLAEPFNIQDYRINLSVSMGVSIYPVDGVAADVLVKKADKAMQYIKEHGHNNFHFSTRLSESSSQDHGPGTQ